MPIDLAPLVALRTQGRLDDALGEALALAASHPDDAELRFFIACLHDARGEEALAIPHDEAALRSGVDGLGDTSRQDPQARSSNADANAVPQPLEPPKRALDDVIAEHLDAARASGELASAKSWGRPLDLGDGWDDTPAELRMPMKILKDAGIVPYEVTLMRDIDTLHRQVDAGAFADDPGGLLAANAWPRCSRTSRCGSSGCGQAGACDVRPRRVPRDVAPQPFLSSTASAARAPDSSAPSMNPW